MNFCAMSGVLGIAFQIAAGLIDTLGSLDCVRFSSHLGIRGEACQGARDYWDPSSHGRVRRGRSVCGWSDRRGCFPSPFRAFSSVRHASGWPSGTGTDIGASEQATRLMMRSPAGCSEGSTSSPGSAGRHDNLGPRPAQQELRGRSLHSERRR